MVRKRVVPFFLCLLVGTLALKGCSGGSSQTLESITPTNGTITSGQATQFAAAGVSSDNSSQNRSLPATRAALDVLNTAITGTGLAADRDTATFAATLDDLSGAASPTVASPETVYWGDLHVHSGYSKDGDPDTNPDTACYYAKQNGLNFMAITDHGERNGTLGMMTDALWHDTIDKLQSGNCMATSTFIPFAGYEWSSATFGHRSVIFKELSIPWSAVYDSKEYKTPTALWGALDAAGYQRSALTIPHHPAASLPASVDWSYHHTIYQPVVEIYSEHGNSEDCETDYDPIGQLCTSTGTVQYALQRNYKLGIIAGTDCHDAQAGSVDAPDRFRTEQPYSGGLIAVLASSLTRNNIWDAIKSKRVYATSGPRILMTFHINEYSMGAAAMLPANTKPTLHITATGAGSNISRIDIIKNGNSSRPAHSVGFSAASAAYSWTDHEYKSGDYYYIRIIQNDLERAWSSPIWVTTE